MTQKEISPLVSGEKVSRAFFAALLEAKGSQCDCKVCKILKRIADDMTKEFV